jgi:NodT family efflux transporter outer membrane factor (OMF) lipoprotein
VNALKAMGIVVSAMLTTWVLSGCVNLPKSDVPSAAAAQIPATWRATTSDGRTAELTSWWNEFSDAQLRALIDKALAQNYDLKAAVERTRQAQALITVARANLYPQVDVTADAARLRSHVPPPARMITDSAVGVSGLWDIDIFGGNQLRGLAQTAQASATEEARRDFEVALTANVATAYMQLRGLQRQLEILSQNIGARADTLHLTKVRYQAGLATDLDVSRAETQLRQVEASVPDVQRQIDNDLGTLAILTGDTPESIDSTLTAAAPIPASVPALPAQAPAALLERRPDLRQAARGIDAAAANLGSAQADLLPKFTLSFAGSVDRLDFGGLPTVTDNLFNVGLGIFWPLFNAGRIHANITAQDAALRQAEYAFDQALLNALQDVESAYTDVRAQRQRSALLGLAVESAQRSAKLAQDLYNAGQADFLSVLDTHTQLLDTQRDLAQAQTDAAVSAVSLYRALGGGWRTSVATASVSPISTSAPMSAATP